MKDIGILKFYSSDLDKEISIKDYLKELLYEVWKDGEGFSGKRPFGNSGWEFDLCKCLVTNNLVSGFLDEDGELEDYDVREADKLVLAYIKNDL
jgi:hypothetical protein